MVQETLQGTIAVSSNDTVSNNIELYFDIITEHSISVQNQITDNYLENNTAIQDHIAHSPVVISLRGLSGEAVYIPSTNTDPATNKDGLIKKAYNYAGGYMSAKTGISNVPEKLAVIPALLPPVDNITQLAKNAVTYVEASYNRYKKIIKNFINPLERRNRLKIVYRDLKALRDSNASLIVKTPYETFGDMYIQSVAFRQGNENYVTDIELTLKQLQFTEVQVTGADKEVLAKYNATARAPEENHGTVQGVKKSLAAQIVDGDKFTLF